MANGFAWAWKLTELGKPVILIYLGFLACEDMQDAAGQSLIASRDTGNGDRVHSRPLFPREVWNRKWSIHGQSFIPLIRTFNRPLGDPQTVL